MNGRKAALFAAIGIIAIAAFAASLFVIWRELGVSLSPHDSAYSGSASCLSCHPKHYASWHRTYHRTMTQQANAQSVLADFDAAAYDYEGIRSRFTHEGDAFFIETAGADSQLHRFRVERTIGSRRVQQYLTRVDDRWFRLPLAWNVAERRWFHLNGGFLDPDGTPFNTHLSLWDGNCIFCHNVGANPGLDFRAKRFNASVAELGVACEACHGPGGRHVEANRSPLRRYVLHYSSRRDPTILSPLELPKKRQVQVCGHCHGQRLPNPPSRIRELMAFGDSDLPGDDLDAVTTPLTRASQLHGVDVTLRFWRDGTPRLTAYEYQGLTMSADYQKGNLTCASCHTLHGGDPRGMIRPEMRGRAACANCHPAIVRNVTAHTRHRANGSGSDCYACHMPKIVYGILDVHPTHRIQKPEPSRAWRYSMPEACTLCHTDRTARWAAESMSARFGTPRPDDIPTTPDFDVAEDIRQLLSGDVVQRSVAVMALGDDRSHMWAIPLLLTTMEDDYASVRHFAWRALQTLVPARELASLPRFDPQATAGVRRSVVETWQAWWRSRDKSGIVRPDAAVPLDEALQPRHEIVERLRAQQKDRMISIGE